METVDKHAREIVLPTASFAAIRSALTSDLDADTAARALQRAGHAAGDALFGELLADAADASASAFWERLARLFAERGWGRLGHEAVHPGIGALECPDWAEADPSAPAARPSCFFTTGLLANVLGRVAGDEVGVLEVECRSRGDLRCRFLYGGRAALEPVYRALRSGRDVEQALAELA